MSATQMHVAESYLEFKHQCFSRFKFQCFWFSWFHLLLCGSFIESDNPAPMTSWNTLKLLYAGFIICFFRKVSSSAILLTPYCCQGSRWHIDEEVRRGWSLILADLVSMEVPLQALLPPWYYRLQVKCCIWKGQNYQICFVHLNNLVHVRGPSNSVV